MTPSSLPPSKPEQSEPEQIEFSSLSPSEIPIDQSNPKHTGKNKAHLTSIKARLIAWGIALSTLPVLAVGTATYFTSETLNQQLRANPELTTNWDEAQSTLQNRIPPLLVGTGIVAILSGGLAVWLINRELRPLRQAGQHSNQLVNRLYRLETGPEIKNNPHDELLALANNISLIEAQIPNLIHSQEHEAARAELLMQFIGELHVALSEEDLLKTTVAEVRQILQTDRVTIFALNSDGDGTFVAESVAPGYPKLQWSTLHDPCFNEGYQEKYRQGRVSAIDNIYNSGLNDCHIGLLERFAVKANIVAPILQNEKLYGLLIAHQCARPREWNQSEIGLFRQLALQVGYALDRARVMSQLDSQINQMQQLLHFTQLIHESLHAEDILTNTVQESRKVLRADRVIVYSFDADWQGTVAAEAVQPGIPKMVWAKISDPCFAEKYVEQYRRGRVQAISNVYDAGLTECHIQQLEQYGVQANLVVPILVGEDLFGLLIAHQCSGPRTWQPSEIELLTQIGIQMGHGLEQANILTQTEQEWITNTSHIGADNEQLTTLRAQLSEFLQANQPSIQSLVDGVNQHVETAQSAYSHIQTIMDFAQEVNTLTRQFQSQNHQIVAQVEVAQTHPPHIPPAAQSAITQLQELEKPLQQLSQIRILVNQLSSQMQRQVMNIAAKATQDSGAYPELSSSAHKISSVAQKIEDNLAQMKPILESLQRDLQQNTATLEPLAQQTSTVSTERIKSEQLSSNLNAEMTQLNDQMMKLTQIVSSHLQTSSTASHQIFELNQFLQRLALQAQSMQTSIQRMGAMVASEQSQD